MISLIDNGQIRDDVKEAPDMRFDDGFGIPVKNGSVNPSSNHISGVSFTSSLFYSLSLSLSC